MDKQELRDKLHKKINGLKSRRCGDTLRSARSMVSKTERQKLQKEVRKQGVDALANKLGITDPEMKRLITKMIKDGDVTTMDEILAKLGDIQNKQKEKKEKMDEEAKKLKDVGPPTEVLNTDFIQEAIPTLPGARKRLKPLSDTLKFSAQTQS